MRAANIDDDAIAIELFRDECGINHECRAMQRLRRPENTRRETNGQS